MPMPPWPSPTPAEIDAVTRVLQSGRINYHTGSEGKSFETEFASSVSRAHAIALANGTLALELALKAYGIGAGDSVVVPSRTFIATASAVVAVGARPIVCDIDPDSGNMTAETVRAVLADDTRAVIPVHFGGWPVEMDPIMELARERDLIVIEDCAQAHGGYYRERIIGSIGHAAAFSFCQDKIVTTGGEGGMLVFDDDEAYKRAWEYKDHGKSLDKVSGRVPAPGRNFKWLHDSFGTNWRMTEMQAAIGRVALGELPGWLERRRLNAERLTAALAGVPGLRVPEVPGHMAHAYYRLYAFIEPDMLADGWSRDDIIEAIGAEGVPCFYGGCAEIYRELAFVNSGLAPEGRLPGAAKAHDTSVVFLVHPTMGDADVDDVAAAVKKVMAEATR